LSTGIWWFSCFRFLAAGRGLDYRYVPLTAAPAAAHGSADEAMERLEPLLATLG
jgi:hypothetical protein